MKVKIYQFAFATLGCLLCPSYPHIAFASSTVVPVQINKPVQKGYQFDVKRRNDRNPQQYAFSVDIAFKQVGVPEQYDTFWGLIHQTSSSTSVKGLRKVPCERRSNHVLCNFTVPKKSLANPDLAFFFETPVFIKVNETLKAMQSASIGFFKLKNVPVQQGKFDN